MKVPQNGIKFYSVSYTYFCGAKCSARSGLSSWGCPRTTATWWDPIRGSGWASRGSRFRWPSGRTLIRDFRIHSSGECHSRTSCVSPASEIRKDASLQTTNMKLLKKKIPLVKWSKVGLIKVAPGPAIFNY